jgi:hypothetical protein
MKRGDVDWIDLVEDEECWKALVKTVMTFRVPGYVRNFLSSCTTGGFSTRAEINGVSSISRIELN